MGQSRVVDGSCLGRRDRQVAVYEKINVARFCREHGMGRDAFYRYLTRFWEEAEEALSWRSQRSAHE
jgi:hypothetical protein